MRCLLLFLCLAACDDDASSATDLATEDLAPVGVCPAATMCTPGEHCTYPGFEPVTCTCVSPENVSCCVGGAGANCATARPGGVCCGEPIPHGSCGNGCTCTANHWVCPGDGGA